MEMRFCTKKPHKVDDEHLNNMDRVVLSPKEYEIYNSYFPKQDRPVLHYKGHALVIRTTYE